MGCEYTKKKKFYYQTKIKYKKAKILEDIYVKISDFFLLPSAPRLSYLKISDEYHENLKKLKNLSMTSSLKPIYE